jgi:SAM-dependent methyltransferase
LRILDLGVGNGESMKLIKKMGGDVFGVEVSETLYNLAISNDLNVRFGTLSECNFGNESFDYIRSNHSFEHLTNPLETLHELNRILKPNGELFIGIPNSGSILYKLFKNKWYYFGTPFHPFNYNDRNIKLLLEKTGFEAVKIRYTGNFNGIIGSIQIYLNDQSDQKAFSNNFLFRVIAHQFARILNLFKSGDCIEVIAKKNN